MKTKFLSVLAVTALLFTACGNDESIKTPEINDGQVHFSSGITATDTRVSSVSEWEGNEAIGVYMVENGGTTITESAENIRYTTTSTGAVATFISTTPIYYPVDATEKVDFIAYHPYSASVSNYVYNVEVTNQSDQSAIDLMVATDDNGGAGYDKTQGATAINLAFDHKLTKVIFKTTADDGLSQADLNNMTVTIKGMNTKAVYHIDTDNLETPTDIVDIAMKTTVAGNYYEGIVLPQAAANVTVEFALNNAKNEVFVYELPARTFAAGEEHTFNVKVQRTRVEVSGTINSWIPAPETSGEAK